MEPTKKQLEYLKKIGYKGRIPKTAAETSELLDKLIDKIPPTKKQLGYIKGLGRKGKPPRSKKEAQIMIDRLLIKGPPSAKQWNYIQDLGYRGKYPKTVNEAGEIIDRLLKQRPEEKPKVEKPWRGELSCGVIFLICLVALFILLVYLGLAES